MVRSNDIVIPPDTSWLNDPGAAEVCTVIERAGYQIFFVGGCVRNAILGLADSDVDMSTNAHPDQVMEVAEAAGLKAVPTGIDHGTVTVVAHGTPFEITTFRHDVETDGRRAVVAFSDNMEDDARRRDFTMNALYATVKGCIIDPLGGLPDLLARRIRFIEDPEARIKEDYLRILRFFRFSAWYADPAEGFDADALAAISANTDGIETLSAERVGQEIVKLLSAPDPAPAVAGMRQTNVLNAVLPGADDRLLPVLVHLEERLSLEANWVNRLAILGGDEAATRFRLSKADTRRLGHLHDFGFAGPSLAEVAYRYGQEAAEGALLLRAALAEQMPDMAMLETIKSASTATIPVKAKDLLSDYEGPVLGAKLKEIEQKWIDSGFTLSRDALLREV
ncbi:MAG: CCA tRNA nucleotidyltransferase [Sulfitobacter sp.]|nr:CCA tRNA nucleotidyltransferase [Sulfitobacter sp.]